MWGVQSPVDLAVTILAFGLVLALWMAGALIWLAQRFSQQKQIQTRLGLREEESAETRTLRLWKDGQEITTAVTDRLSRRSWREWPDRLRREAGWESPAHTIAFGVVGGLTLLFVVILSLTGSSLAGLGAILAGFAIFWTYLKQCISRCAARFERQLADALDLAARSLRAGHPLIGSFRVVGEEVAAPVGTLFAEVCQQQSLGVPLETALRRVAEDARNDDLKLFTTSVIIQLRSGGDLADMMDRVAAVIRDRIRLAGRVRTLTAQTQFSKRILMTLPFVMFAVMNLCSREYVLPLYTTSSGRLLLALAGAMMLVGGYIMNKLAVLRY